MHIYEYKAGAVIQIVCMPRVVDGEDMFSYKGCGVASIDSPLGAALQHLLVRSATPLTLYDCYE